MKANSLFGIQAGGRFINDDELRLTDQSLRDSQTLPHASRKSAESLLSRIVKINALKQSIHQA